SAGFGEYVRTVVAFFMLASSARRRTRRRNGVGRCGHTTARTFRLPARWPLVWEMTPDAPRIGHADLCTQRTRGYPAWRGQSKHGNLSRFYLITERIDFGSRQSLLPQDPTSLSLM